MFCFPTLTCRREGNVLLDVLRFPRVATLPDPHVSAGERNVLLRFSGLSRVGGRGHCSVTLDVVIAVQSLCSGLTSQHSGQAPCDQNCE